jgi:hypothetical protein
VTSRTTTSSCSELDLVGLRRALGARTQAEAAQLLGVTANTWARSECSSTQLEGNTSSGCCNW